MNENNSSFLGKLQKRSGKYFPILIVAAAQLLAFPMALIGSLLIQLTANYTSEQLAITIVPTFLFILLGNILLLGISVLLCRNIIKDLGKRNEGVINQVDELIAWKEITSFPWKYGSIAVFIGIVIDVLPVATYMWLTNTTTYDQYVYSLIGGFVSAISSILLAIILIETWLLPLREELLPGDTENQLKGAGGFWSNLFGKNLITTITLVVIAVLLVAPIGYRQTTKVLMEEIGSIQVLNDLKTESVLVSSIAILMGTGLVFLLTRSVTRPIQELIDTFKKVEMGDLSQRAKILATDEVGQLAIYFNRMISRLDELQQTLEKRVAERTDQLRASNEVGQIASTILDPDTVIARVVQLITETFDYYYAAIFLVSENERWAELKDATGTAGEALKARHHRLQLNNTSMVGAAITTRQPQVALDTGETAVRFNNPLLPNTRSEIAIPLVIGDRVIGALDVQSIRGADFKPDNISTLQSMANQVAIAIENARLFTEMEQALSELSQANRQYVVSAWSDKTRLQKLEYTTESLPADINDETQEMEVSLNLREESIGSIKLETENGLDQEDRAWLEALATQVAISLENARLVEESQQSALRDRLSTSIVQKLWASNSIDSILQTAIRELGQALEASEATIELKMEE